MGQWIGNHIAVLEMGLSAVILFAFLGWQYWTTRDARFPDPELPADSARAAGHPEGEHQPDERVA